MSRGLGDVYKRQRENEQTERIALPMMKRAAKKYDSTILMQAVRHLQTLYGKSLKYDWI